MSESVRKWHRQFSVARRSQRPNERIWARDCSLVSRPGAGPLDISKFENGKEYTSRSAQEIFQILSQSNLNRRYFFHELLTDEMRHSCFYYCIDIPAPSHIKWNDSAVRFVASVSVRYFVRHLRSAFSSLTRADVDESNVVCMNASKADHITWFIVFRKVIFYDHHVSMREYIEEAMIGLYTELRQIRRQLNEQKSSEVLQAVIDVAIAHGLINSTKYGPLQALPILGASMVDTGQVLRLIPTQFAIDSERPTPPLMRFCDGHQENFLYSFEQWQSCLVHQPDNFIVNRYAIRLWPLPDSICTSAARKTYPEGYQDLPNQDRYVTWAPKFLRQSRTVWDRMKQDVIDQFRQKLLAMPATAASETQPDSSIEGDRAVIRDDGTRWRAQDLEEGDAVFCPLHQARDGEARAALFTFWLSTLSVDRIRAEAVIYPSRFRPGFSNGRVIFCTGACKRMITIMEIPEQVAFQNEATAGAAHKSKVQVTVGNKQEVDPPTTVTVDEEDPAVAVSPVDVRRPIVSDDSEQGRRRTQQPNCSDSELIRDYSRLIVVEGIGDGRRAKIVAAHLNAVPSRSFAVLTTTMSMARTLARTYDAHCYANMDTKTATFAPRCTIAFDFIGNVVESLPKSSKWEYIVLDDAFCIYLVQQFGLADETEPNMKVLAGICRCATAVFAVGEMMPSSVIDFIGRSLCCIDLDMHPDQLQTLHFSAPDQLNPICCYRRIVDLFDYQILTFLQNYDSASGMSAQPAVTFCTSIEFAKLLQWILQQICRQYGYDSGRVRIYDGADENRDSLASERFNIAQALKQTDELLVTSLTLSGYNVLHFFRRHFTYFHDGVFTQTTFTRIENRISGFGKDDDRMARHVWYRTFNTGFSALNAKRLSHVLSAASNKQSPPKVAESNLPAITELACKLSAGRGVLPDDWLPSDFKYSAETSPTHRLRWLFSTISGYFDLQKKREVPEWACDADLKAVANDFEFDVELEGLLRAVAHDGMSGPTYSMSSVEKITTKPDNQNLNAKRNGTRRSV